MKLQRLPFYYIVAVLLVAFALIIKSAITPNVMGVSDQNEGVTEVIVKYKVNTPETERQKIRNLKKTKLKQKIDKIRAEVIEIQSGSIEDAISEFKKSPLVEYAEPNSKAYMAMASNDSSLSQQWGLYKINAANNTQTSAWDLSTGSNSIKIAILDTGVEASHPDLTGKLVGENNFTSSPSVNDVNGHGTHVAGIAAAATNNAQGVAGSGYNSAILNAKVLADDGSGYYSWVINGIIWSADQNAKVISLSLGGTASSLALSDAVNYAWNKGSIVIAAAGNNSTTSPHYPAYYENTIAVAATDSNDNKASFSNYGSDWVDIAAPGTSIYSTYKGNSYATMSGTSMATPMVSGIAGLVFAQGKCTTNTCVRAQIEKSADQIPATGSSWKWGRINAYRALYENHATTPTPTTAPSPTPTATPTPTSVSQNTMTVSDIKMSYIMSTNNYRKIFSKITVVNAKTNAPISSARVYATITSPSGKVTQFSGYTNSSGIEEINIRSKELGTYITRVTNITKSGYTYTPVITSKSLLVQ